jgi:hypothetical protein
MTRMIPSSRSQSPQPRTRARLGDLAIRMPGRVLKPLLLVISAGLVLAFGTAAPATAAAPCWKALINDWFDGSIDHTYQQQCYRQAIQHLPTDVEVYSSAKDDIEAAMLASLRDDHDGGNANGGSPSSNKGPSNGNSGSDAEKPNKGVITRAIEWLGPSNAASVPLPLLILAGVAFLLLAAAGGSFLNRRMRERRTPPPPQT